MEKVDIRKVRCIAKVVGTIATIAGAMLMTLYKGQVINFFWTQYMHHPTNYAPPNSSDSAQHDWVKGSILLIIATLAWASFFILQVYTLTHTHTYISKFLIIHIYKCFLMNMIHFI